MYKLYIVEDDQTIATAIKNYLEKWDYTVFITEDFNKITKEVFNFDPALVLMDISLPHFNGFYWCQKLREFTKVPIIFISSSNEPMSTVMAINMGADDYITKPFDLSILLAKISALLRRTYDFKTTNDLLIYKGLQYHRAESNLAYNNQKIELTKNENRILDVLFDNRGTIVSREVLMHKLWQTDQYIDENTLSVNIGRLRKKLEAIGILNLIITKKNVGYIINEE